MSAFAAVQFQVAGVVAARAPAKATRRGSSVVVRAAPKPGVDGVPYTASNTFIVPDGDATIIQRFQEEMAARQALMKTLPGFTSCKLTAGSGNEFTFEQEWTTKQAYEDYMNHPQRRKSHLAAGIYQYMPKNKWSVPENFTPILPRK